MGVKMKKSDKIERILDLLAFFGLCYMIVAVVYAFVELLKL